MRDDLLAKKVAGNEWLSRDGAFADWVMVNTFKLRPTRVREVMEYAIAGMSVKEIALKMGLQPGTVNNLLTKAHAGLAMLLGEDRSMFRSIKEFQFSDEVDGAELGMALYGRLTRNVQETFLPKVVAGLLDLPMPRLTGQKYVWTKDQAEKWREWYCGRRNGE